MKKKKILILSCLGGYGHVAAANTLIALLGDKYHIDTMYPIKELRIWKMDESFKFYNFLISNNLNRTTNFIVNNFTTRVFRNRKQKTEELVAKHIYEKQPDLIISVTPLINYPAAEAARKAGIPYLLVTTDNDLTKWAHDLEQLPGSDITVTIGYDLASSKGLLLQHNIREQNIRKIGLPLRPSFLEKKDRNTLRTKYGVPADKKVVLVMLGSVGARSTYQFVKKLINSSHDIHLVVCAGRNARLSSKLERLQKDNCLTVIPFTEHVDELFALSDLVITKPGPGSINEAIACKLPILVDYTREPVFWEKANIDFVQSNQIGESIHNLRRAPDLVHRYLFDETTRYRVALAYEHVEENCFAKEIVPLVDQMCCEVLDGELVMTSRSYNSSTLV